jgi:hypothetical protein
VHPYSSHVGKLDFARKSLNFSLLIIGIHCYVSLNKILHATPLGKKESIFFYLGVNYFEIAKKEHGIPEV